MANITHPSMRKPSTVQTQEQPKKNVVVVDQPNPYTEESMDTSVYFKSNLEPDTKKKIEDLVFLGRISKDVTIAGHVFSLSTMSHREYNVLMKELSKITESASIFNVRTYTLAMAVRKVDGVSVDDIDCEGEFESMFDKNVAIFDGLQLKVVEQLFAEYSKMVEETEEIKSEDLKK